MASIAVIGEENQISSKDRAKQRLAQRAAAKRILEDIVLCADILPTDLVIEVGPGLGHLPNAL